MRSGLILLIIICSLHLAEARAGRADSVFLILQKKNSITLSSAIKADWQPYKNFNLPNTLSGLWAKITFTPEAHESIIEVTGYLNGFTAYYFEDNQWKEINSRVEGKSIKPLVTKLTVPLTIARLQPTVVYIKTNTLFVRPDFKIFSKEYYHIKQESELILMAIIMGFLVFVMFNNGFYFALDKNMLYFYYSTYVFFLMLSVYLIHPAFHRFFVLLIGIQASFETPFPLTVIIISNVFANLCGIVYSYHFLEIRKISARLRMVYKVYFVLACIGFAFILLNQASGFSIRIVHILTISTLLLSVFAGLYSSSKGNRFGLLFALAYIIFTVFFLLKLASSYGLIPFNNMYFAYGVLFEVVILVYALGSKMLEEKNSNKKQLLETNAELANQNTQLEQYAYMVAHNLRAPVARLLGLTNLLKRTGTQDNATEEIVEKINKSASEFDHVIRDISSILEVKKGMRFAMEEIVLKNEIDATVTFLEDEILETNAEIILNLTGHECVHGMRPYISSIFTNLISNAIKYRDISRVPEITISTTLESNFVKIVVSDNGLGIDLFKYKDKIFEPFKRFHTHREGRGLGLHLVRTEVEAMGGRIEVSSTVGKGTLFTIYLQSHIPLT